MISRSKRSSRKAESTRGLSLSSARLCAASRTSRSSSLSWSSRRSGSDQSKGALVAVDGSAEAGISALMVSIIGGSRKKSRRPIRHSPHCATRLCADHQPDDLVAVGLARPALAGLEAAAEDDHAVGDGEDVTEPDG